MPTSTESQTPDGSALMAARALMCDALLILDEEMSATAAAADLAHAIHRLDRVLGTYFSERG